MGRHALVDRDVALDRIMWQFWRAGYEASSIDELLAASGLQRASFYRAFGDKHSVFLAALQRYMQQAGAAHVRPALTKGSSPRRRLMRLLYRRLDAALGIGPGAREPCGPRPGCLLVNAAIEMAPHDPEIQALVDVGLGAIRNAIAKLVREAVDAGEARDDLDIARTSHLIFALLQGVNVLARAGASRRELRQLLRWTLEKALDRK